MKPTLFMTIGYPGSGKSYFSKNISKELGIVRLNSGISGHGIREFMYENKMEGWPENNSAVYGALRYAAYETLGAGHSVIFDASNSSTADRTKLHLLAQSQNANAVVVWLQTPIETSRSRAKLRDSDEKSKTVPESHFDKLVTRFERPRNDEKTIIIDGTIAFNEQLKSFKEQLKNRKKQERSIFTTIIATFIGAAVLFVSILILPLSTFGEGMTFAVGILIVILCAIVAIQGKKGTLREIVYSLSFWR